jgi:hypothetical protein
MKLQVVDKEPNRKLVTRQTEGPLKSGKVSRNFKEMVIGHIYNIQ